MRLNDLGNEFQILWDLLQQLVTSTSLENSLQQVNDANQILERHRFEHLQFSKNEIYLLSPKFQLTDILNAILNRTRKIQFGAIGQTIDTDNSELNEMLEEFEYLIFRIGSSGHSPRTKLEDEDVKEFLIKYFVEEGTTMIAQYPNECRVILKILKRLGLSNNNSEYNIVSTNSYFLAIEQLFSIYEDLIDKRFIASLRKSLSTQGAA